MDIIKDLPQGKYNIAIKLSGGCDSSLVYYALCKKFAQRDDVNIIVITLNTDKKSFYIPYSQKIINIVKQLTGKEPLAKITKSVDHSLDNYVNGQDELARKVEKEYSPVHLYTGLTMNPPHDDMVQFFKDNHKDYNLDLNRVLHSLNSRDKERDYTRYPSDDYIINPFGESNKRFVADAYKHYGMMDILYPYTRSCESFSTEEKHCGHCFFCAERIWGFKRLV